jgi:hypothetical protein
MNAEIQGSTKIDASKIAAMGQSCWRLASAGGINRSAAGVLNGGGSWSTTQRVRVPSPPVGGERNQSARAQR